MENYYSKSLNASKLYEVYQTQNEKVKQYLNREIEFVRSQLTPDDVIFEMGAGYGRIMKELAKCVKFAYGIDISENSVAFGRHYLRECLNCDLSVYDVYKYTSGIEYDAVLCLQNGLSAIKGNSSNLVDIAMKVLRKNGKAYFSCYSHKFWDTRLEWFQEQAENKLLGEIDYEKTKEGKIICKDGFTSTTFSISDLERLGKSSGYNFDIQEIDGSSVFLIIQK